MVNVPDIVTPDVTATPTDVSCNGANDGSIQIFLTDNGINPVTYTIAPVAGTFNAATNTFENLPANTYTITATGANTCTTTLNNIAVNEPTAISVPTPDVTQFSCASGNTVGNASIEIAVAPPSLPPFVSGGTGTYVIYEFINDQGTCLLYTSPSPRDLSTSRMPSSA